jgi:hypothetical protein
MLACDPPTLEDYNRLFKERHKITGMGLGIRMAFPCPFCCAPEWLSANVLEFEAKAQIGRSCATCGRAAKALITRQNGGSQIEIVQLSGEDPAPFLPPIRRVAS